MQEKTNRRTASTGINIRMFIILGLEEKLSSLLQVPVISPAISAVSMAEALVRQNLLTSRKAYPTPPLRQRKWQGGML